ncbi:MAG: zinc ribbon domain-containing protein [Polyangiaceae bacterium]|nr:zinc ribbon domain-containing protein [Myxococcales bacterium]MCC6899569.1 zinc ribbon domain-containing protein [Polyangiaceae bacterium]
MTYEYVCTACAHEWEAEQSMSEPALTTCPSCKAEAAKRQVSGGTGFILRGGGWYADGYGSKKPGTSEAAKPSTTPSTPATTKSEPAPAAPAAPTKTSTDS